MDQHAFALSRELAGRSASERWEYYVQRDVPPAVRNEVEALLNSAHPHDGQALSTLATRQLVSIGRYQVLGLLGQGGMGEVHLARDPVLDRNVAVKLISRDCDDDGARQRLVREARAAGRLRHPNIVTIFDAGEHEGRSYIAMEYVPGETLRSLIRRRADLPLGRKLELIEEACAGLAHAHQAGVVHLDIKPDNLMLDETGVLKVLDFGIARVLKGDALATRHLAGTLAYMSPEQLAGRSLDRRSDIFSIGCASFEFLTHAPAYSGSTQEIVTRISAGPVPRLSDVCPEIDPRLDRIVARAMAIDPADRYADLHELRNDLARVRSDSEASPASSRPVDRTTVSALSPATGSRWRWIAAAAAVAIGVGVFLTWTPRQPLSEPPVAADVVSPPQPASTVGPVDSSTPNAASIGDEVWRRVASGERAAVLDFLRPVAADRRGSPDARLPFEVLGAVRTAVLQMRAAAARASTSALYRTAEARLARSERFEAEGRAVDAIGALWEAGDLYTQASALSKDQPPRSQDKVESPPPAQPPVATVGAAIPTPPPPVAGPPRLEAVSPDVKIPAAPPERNLPSDRAAEKTGLSDSDAVLDMIRRYQAAYQALDVSAVVQVFPTLDGDQVAQLRKTFTGLTAYAIDVQNPQVTVESGGATVRGLVVRRMVPRVGRPVVNQVETEFRLRREANGWVISAVTTR